MSEYNASGRHTRNIVSKAWARRDGQPWTDADDQLLLDRWIGRKPDARDEVDISKELARTIESCRVRCEHIRARLGLTEREIQPKNEPKPYIGAEDDTEDQWWSPGYYNNGGGYHA